ncbi:hypothetical protein BDF22DRAFT_662812 [Syncephalis plumigaleata]|nr:hypothetical protein BDF22DRAFT_662812 [Syncephalis plumigaleata]
MLNLPIIGSNHNRNPSAPNLTAVQPQVASHSITRSRTPDDRTSSTQAQRQPVNNTDLYHGAKMHKSVSNNSGPSATSKPHKIIKTHGIEINENQQYTQGVKVKPDRLVKKQGNSRGRSPNQHIANATTTTMARKRVSRSLERPRPSNFVVSSENSSVRRGSEDSIRCSRPQESHVKTSAVNTNIGPFNRDVKDGIYEPLSSPLSPQHRPATEELGGGMQKRRLLRFGPVLQVITSRTVKDRMLFLFPDLLIIVKPILPDGQQLASCNLDCRFQCRAIIPLGDVSMAMMREEAMSPPDLAKLLDPEVRKAVRQFPEHPYRAIHQLVKRNLLRHDAASIAGFLLRTRGLDRRNVGKLLSRPENTPVLAAFLERLPAHGIPLPDLLRLLGGHMLLPPQSGSTIRLDATNTDNIAEFAGTWELHRPVDNANDKKCELASDDAEARARCIILIADRWRMANPDYRLGRRSAVALVYTVLMASRRNTATTTALIGDLDITRFEGFAQLFARHFSNYREDDGRPLVIPDLLLRHTFESTWIRPIRLDEPNDTTINISSSSSSAAAAASTTPTAAATTNSSGDREDVDPSGRLWISVGTFPLRVTVRVPSTEIIIQLPQPDPHLQLYVVTENGLKPSMDILDFTANREARITLTGVSVGRCVVAFELIGANATRYSPIPPRTLSVERSFMRWAFRIRCESTLFSLEDLPAAMAHPASLLQMTRHPSGQDVNDYTLKDTSGKSHHTNHSNTSGPLQIPSILPHREMASDGEDEDDIPIGTKSRLDLGTWREATVGQGRAVKLSFSVESRDRQSAWCTMIEERARIIREQRDRTLPSNAPVGEADRPGRSTRDRFLATHLARLLLPVTDEQAARSMTFTGKELVKLVGRYDSALRD